MNIINYFESDRKEHWLTQIKKCDWRAGMFLHELLTKGTFFDATGKDSKLLLLTDEDKLVSFCTYAQKDEIPTDEMSPWMGFVYTYPEYRGHRYVGLLVAEALRLSRLEGNHYLYVSTDHIGLYEKYGFEFLQEMKSIDGENSRVYRQKTIKLRSNQVEIHYSWNKIFEKKDIEELFLSVNWESGKYPERITKALKNSSKVVSAWDGNKLVGLVRALDDGDVCAFIHYLLVNPTYQGHHIGDTLMKMLMEQYKDYLYVKIMPSNPDTIPFYRKYGFEIYNNYSAMEVKRLLS